MKTPRLSRVLGALVVRPGLERAVVDAGDGLEHLAQLVTWWHAVVRDVVDVLRASLAALLDHLRGQVRSAGACPLHPEVKRVVLPVVGHASSGNKSLTL